MVNVAGFVEYRIIKGVQVSAGQFKYACYDDDGEHKQTPTLSDASTLKTSTNFVFSGAMHSFTLCNGSKSDNPLQDVNRVELKIADDKERVVGIILEDDCALFAGTSQ